MKCWKRITTILLALSLVACSTPPSPTEYAVTGGAVGAGVGAGTGAIIASAMANGDVAASALLGGGVGLGVGALGAAYIAYNARNEPLRRMKAQSEANAQVIEDNEAKIRQLREELSLEAGDVSFNGAQTYNVYVGPTIGVAR